METRELYEALAKIGLVEDRPFSFLTTAEEYNLTVLLEDIESKATVGKAESDLRAECLKAARSKFTGDPDEFLVMVNIDDEGDFEAELQEEMGDGVRNVRYSATYKDTMLDSLKILLKDVQEMEDVKKT